MKKMIKYGVGVIAILAMLAGGAAYVLFGITKTADIRGGVLQVYNENVLGRIGANMTVFETERGLVVVDAHLAPLIDGARSKIAKRSDKKILAVFNTHWHPDHSGGNGKLTEEADIIAHKNVRQILTQDQKGFGLTKPGSVHEFDATPAEALPEILVDGSAQTFTQYGGEFRAVHYPKAHTSGDLVIFVPRHNIVVLGDLVWPRAFPFVDVYNGGTAQGIHDALASIADTTDQVSLFLIGHGAPISHSELVEYKNMIAASIAFVKAEKSKGRSLPAVQELGLPAGLLAWESKLTPAAEWIKMIYETI